MREIPTHTDGVKGRKHYELDRSLKPCMNSMKSISISAHWVLSALTPHLYSIELPSEISRFRAQVLGLADTHTQIW